MPNTNPSAHQVARSKSAILSVPKIVISNLLAWNRIAAGRFSATNGSLEALGRASIVYTNGGILSKGEGLATKTLSELIKSRNIQAIDFEFERALKNIESGPGEAVSAACNILESAFKVYLEEHTHLAMPAKQDFQGV